MKKFLLFATIIVLIFSRSSCHSNLDGRLDYLLPGVDLLPFHLIAQPDNISCGPTCATMVLHKCERYVELDEVRKLTKTDWVTVDGHKIGMTSPDCLRDAIRQLGLPRAFIKTNCDLEDLKTWTTRWSPVIVLVRSGKYTMHYIVVTGYGEAEGGYMIVADPGGGVKRYIKNDIFKSAWSFTTDTLGNPMGSRCPLCGGTGNLFKLNLGPLTFCELCNGTGTMVDWTVLGLMWADIYPCTAIVPIREPHL